MTERAKMIQHIVDRGVGALSTLWPRSQTAREVARLVREGYRRGAAHEIEFSITFEDSCAGAALEEVLACGFTLRDRADAKPCCTVTAPMRLSAYHLHVTTARLQRVLAGHGGFAAVIGPVVRDGLSAEHGFTSPSLPPTANGRRIDLPAVRARA
jgi:hypothetical protein